MTKKLFITGTNTDIGKTFVTAGIASIAIASGKRVSVIKPVQTGTDEYPADLCEIRKIVPEIEQLPGKIATPYSFGLPASPHLAAAQENTVIDLSVIKHAVDKAETISQPDILLIEGAGGVIVPLTEEKTFLDLLKILKIPVIITAPAGLGTINHTMMTVETLKNAGIAIAGIIFNRMPSDPGIVEKDNVKIVEKMSGIPVLAVIRDIPYNKSFSRNIRIEFEQQTRLIKFMDLHWN